MCIRDSQYIDKHPVYKHRGQGWVPEKGESEYRETKVRNAGQQMQQQRLRPSVRRELFLHACNPYRIHLELTLLKVARKLLEIGWDHSERRCVVRLIEVSVRLAL